MTMTGILIPAAIIIVCIYVWFLNRRTPHRGKIYPEQSWPAPPAPSAIEPPK